MGIMATFAEMAGREPDEDSTEDVRDERIARLQENLDRLESQLDRGWMPLYSSYDEQEGPRLEQVKEAAKRNRELVVLNPHIGNGLELINSYVWADGIHYEGVPTETRGGGTNVQALIDNPINQENYFNELARKQRQAAFYCDGMAMYYGENTGSGKEIHPLSIMDITDDIRNPQRPAEIWAFRRTWTDRSNRKNPQVKNEWIFVNRFESKRGTAKTVEYGGKDEPIALDKTIFYRKSNPIVGWAYGTADVQRGISWAEDYRQAMLDGKSMNASMASIMATAKNNTPAGAQAQAIALGNMTGAGGVAATGQGQGWQVLPTAGQAYDFQRLLPLLANFAAGIGVSVIALSMNSGNAGGSYGAARSLDRPEQLSTKTRRAYNGSLDREVLLWLGCKEADLEVWFDPIIDLTEKYRGEQIAELRLGTGLYDGAEVKKMHAELDGKDPSKATVVPEGWLIPNNKKTLEAESKIAAANAPDPSNGGAFTPTQGSGAKTAPNGGQDQKSDDIRTNREAFLRDVLANDDMAGIMVDLINELRASRGD